MSESLSIAAAPLLPRVRCGVDDLNAIGERARPDVIRPGDRSALSCSWWASIADSFSAALMLCHAVALYLSLANATGVGGPRDAMAVASDVEAVHSDRQ